MLISNTMTVLVTIVFSSSIGKVTGREIEFQCNNADEYLYAVPGSQCSSYYKCLKGRVIKSDCEKGSYFQYFEQNCSRKEGVCYEPVCSRPNGKYADTTHACRRVFECQDGRIKSISICPLGQLFDGQICKQEALVTCPLPENTAIAYPKAATDRDCSLNPNSLACVNSACRNQPDGNYPDPSSTNCRDYLKCENGIVASRENCGDLGVFDGSKCVPEQVYQCPTSPITASSITSLVRTQLVDNFAKKFDICTSKSNGFHINPRFGCRAYVKCTSGRTISNLMCPLGFYFDINNKSCMISRGNDLSNQFCLDPVPSTDCDQRNNGYYSIKTPKSSCKDYFYCYNGNKTCLRCLSGQVFNGKECVDKTKYECPVEEVNSCSGKSDGYYKDATGGSCRSYYYCADGKKATYLCAEGQMFDGEKCIRKQSYHVCGSTDCLNKPEGYYTNFTSGCRSYYYCKNGDKANMFTCRGDRLYNGQKCVPPENYKCPSSINDYQKSNCIPKDCKTECQKDGFYPDIESRCEQYFICIGGRKSAVPCSEGQVFNGDNCVSDQQYQCPEYCDNHVDCEA